MIISTSCLAEIRRQLPGERIIFAAREVMRPLLEGHPLLDGFVGLPTGDSVNDGNDANDGNDQETLAHAFRACEADAIVHLQPDAFCQSAAARARIPRRIGYGRGFFGDRTLTEHFPDRRARGDCHEAQSNFDLLAPLGVGLPGPTWDTPLRPAVHLPEEGRTSVKARLAAMRWQDFDNGQEKYAVINPTAHALDLRWPPEHFAWLADGLLSGGVVSKIVFVGDRANDPSMETIRQILGPGRADLIDLSGTTNLADLGWILRFARLLVSRNTGTTHLAAAVGCPLVELFGRQEPAYGPVRWRALGDHTEIVTPGPLNRRWTESKRAFWRRGYASIPRDAVLAAALRISGHTANRLTRFA